MKIRPDTDLKIIRLSKQLCKAFEHDDIVAKNLFKTF